MLKLHKKKLEDTQKGKNKISGLTLSIAQTDTNGEPPMKCGQQISGASSEINVGHNKD